MDQNLEKRNETAVSKSNVAAFVHDMKELEIKQFTLRKLHEKCVEERNRTKNNDENKFSATEYAYQTATKKLNDALQNRKIKPQEIVEKPKQVKEPMSIGLLFLIPLPIFHIISILIDQLILYPYQRKNHVAIPEQMIWGILALLIIALIILQIMNHQIAEYRFINYNKKKEKYEQYIQSLSEYEQQEQHLSNCQNQYALAQKEFIHAKKQREEAQKQIEKLDCIAKLLAQHIAEIESKKDQLYALNIVPPDYRTLDSLIEFDQMYRNDLVDTMREAVLIYEERVARKVLIRGIEKIYTMLGKLTSAMHNIESALYSIQSEVSMMSDDVYKIATSSEKFRDDMLSESRAARYAAEALQESTERCEWYMNRQYWKN